MKHCKKCNKATPRYDNGRCVPCKKAYDRQRREARAAAWSTWDPHLDPKTVPPGYRIKGTSILRDGEGKVRAVWHKTTTDETAKHQALLDAFESVADRVQPTEPLPPPPEQLADDLMCVYPMGDPHLGMYAWSEETGDSNFDIEIARTELYRAADQLVSLAPPARTAVVLPLGDFFHSDDSTNRTRKSGHQLDVDGRYAKVIAAGIDTLGRIVDRALQRHEQVVVRCEIGNHDDDSSLWLALCLQQRYLHEPRITVSTSPAKFWYRRFGRVLLGSTHGDTVPSKGPTLSEVMAGDRSKDWGETQHRYWYVGHVHHESVHERPGCRIETFRTLAPRDAWHAAKGYRSGRDMRLDVMHRQFGRINRHIVGIEQVRMAS